jgi:hypothetical protein
MAEEGESAICGGIAEGTDFEGGGRARKSLGGSIPSSHAFPFGAFGSVPGPGALPSSRLSAHVIE